MENPLPAPCATGDSCHNAIWHAKLFALERRKRCEPTTCQVKSTRRRPPDRPDVMA